MGSIGRRGAQRALNHRGDLIVGDCSWPARPGFIQQTLDTTPQKAPAPFADRVLMHAKFDGHDLALDTIRAAKDDPASLRH